VLAFNRPFLHFHYLSQPEKIAADYVEHEPEIKSRSLAIADSADFEKLFRQNYSKLCSYANLFLNDPDAAEDVVQEVFFKLWKNRGELAINTTIRSYLYRAVRNGCMNVIDHISVREAYKLVNEGDIRDNEANMVEEAIVSELEMRIRETIGRLPAERRKIFIMSRFDGLKYREIADQLNISVKTVENQMYQALRFLRENLTDYLPLILLIFKGVFRDE
jgi:RNA polymerase sigma-70 factor, ECF subfamily